MNKISSSFWLLTFIYPIIISAPFEKSNPNEWRVFAQLNAALAAEEEGVRRYRETNLLTAGQARAQSDKDNELVRRVLATPRIDLLIDSLVVELVEQPNIDLTKFFDRHFPIKNLQEMAAVDGVQLTPEQAVGKRISPELTEEAFSEMIDCVRFYNRRRLIAALEMARDDFEPDDD